MSPRNERSRNMAVKSAASANQDLDDSTATQEEKFLEALQNLILSHISAYVGVSRQKEMSEKLAGPEAKKFAMALKEFISSIVGMSASRKSARQEAQMAIKVALNEALTGHKSLRTRQLSPVQLSDPEPTFYEKVLRELHHRVFNRMPIRLLQFVQNGPDLEISLIERAAIYRHLVSALPAYNNGEYKCTVKQFHYPQPPRLETVDEAISRILDKYAGYAILSHTWLQQSPEVTYGNWKAGLFDSRSPGYLKLVNFCRVAHKVHGLSLGWIDTICINKDSSSELDESIRSMYNFYKRSKVCIVYLAETDSLDTMHHDPWFTRGWTLQELLASEELKFYNHLWKPLSNSENDRKTDSITTKIEEATTMFLSELNIHESHVRISRRMQLAALRNVTREEDTAYSLMGLFNVSIATAYGEGAERAFHRLLQEIFNSNPDDVLDLFNWAGGDCSSISKILPRRPQQYLVRHLAVVLRFYEPIEPLTLTHKGIRIPLLLMPGISYYGDPRSRSRPCGKYSASVFITPVREFHYLPTAYDLLPQQESQPDSDSDPCLPDVEYQFTFAVFNFGKAGKDIIIPSRCIAILLACDEDTGKVSSSGPCKRIYTEHPVIFDMLQRNPKQRKRSAENYMVRVEEREIKIPEQELAKHGMQLVYKYL